MAIGPHRMEYEVLEGWEQLPEGWSFVEVAGVAVDSRDRVYVFNRGEHPIIVFDKDGPFSTPGARASFRARTASSSTATTTSIAPTISTTRCASSRPAANC